MGSKCSKQESAPDQSEDPCLWYKIIVNDNKAHVKDVQTKIQGLYRRIDFVDIPKSIYVNTSSSTTPGSTITKPISANNYQDCYQSCNNVYARIYDSKFTEIDQKNEFVFLWNDGQKWVFSNYSVLSFYVGVKLGPQWVISRSQISENNANIAVLSLDYSPQIDHIKMMPRIEGEPIQTDNANYQTFNSKKNKNKNGVAASKFRLKILNLYSLDELKANKENKEEKDEQKHEEQAALKRLNSINENMRLRKSYISWRENLNIYYQKNQTLTVEQIKDEEMKQDQKMRAERVRNMINEIDVIYSSMEFRKLLNKYQDKTVKIVGWEYKDGGMKTDIDDNSYIEFKRDCIERKSDEQLSYDFVRDITIEFHRYYHELMEELKGFEDITLK